ncbi:MAG: 2-hydroxyglutaryl-CoA dehydratase, partial [Planctomycetia bacterium]|nr:2-hydroxyglutaryl-CoA dehydratase [Planctomycetia bacterium]
MITCGIDIGARTVKVVILLDGRVKAREIRDTGPRPAATAQTALADALAQADIRAEQLDATVSTGYGRDVVTCADSTATEITCQARGVRELLPEAR